MCVRWTISKVCSSIFDGNIFFFCETINIPQTEIAKAEIGCLLSWHSLWEIRYGPSHGKVRSLTSFKFSAAKCYTIIISAIKRCNIYSTTDRMGEIR